MSKPTATFGSKEQYDAWVYVKKMKGQDIEEWDVVKKYVEDEVNDLLDTYDELKIEDVLPVATKDEVRKGTDTSKPVSTWEDIQAGADTSKVSTPATYRKGPYEEDCETMKLARKKGGRKKGVVIPNRKGEIMTILIAVCVITFVVITLSIK